MTGDILDKFAQLINDRSRTRGRPGLSRREGEEA